MKLIVAIFRYFQKLPLLVVGINWSWESEHVQTSTGNLLSTSCAEQKLLLTSELKLHPALPKQTLPLESRFSHWLWEIFRRRSNMADEDENIRWRATIRKQLKKLRHRVYLLENRLANDDRRDSLAGQARSASRNRFRNRPPQVVEILPQADSSYVINAGADARQVVVNFKAAAPFQNTPMLPANRFGPPHPPKMTDKEKEALAGLLVIIFVVWFVKKIIKP